MSNRIRVDNVFVSKFDQAIYWMDRAKRAGVPRRMQIEGLLEELRVDLLEVLLSVPMSDADLELAQKKLEKSP